jgi:hypothetical protein
MPGVPLATQVACRKDQEPGQFEAHCQTMSNQKPLLLVSGGVAITAQNLQNKMRLLPETWETASPTTPYPMSRSGEG